MPLEFKRSISDPIYGSVQLTKLEMDIIDTGVFQRLRRVSQLGLAEYVFPSADYSRFAHSIGACHTSGEILGRLGSGSGGLDKEEVQFHRASMLLHDVGHYFMSHAAESAVEQWDEAKRAEDAGPTQAQTFARPREKDCYGHEEVGSKILSLDPELSEVLARNGLDAGRLGRMFEGALDEPYGNLVSSELDADRLDYLKRSSQATGLPYGNFDRDYIIQNMVFSGGRVCLTSKGIRAADHYVMCRTFDYLQVIYHKTVVGFEEMLKRCVGHLLESGALTMSRRAVSDAIKSQEWLRWDDAYLLNLIAAIPKTASVWPMADRITRRKRAELLWSDEELVAASKADSKLRWHRELGHNFEGGPDWTKNCIFWFKHFRPTEVTPFGTSYKPESSDNEAKEKSIHILRKTGEAPVPLTGCRESFTRHLSNQAYVMVRIYYAGPDGERQPTVGEVKALMKKLKHTEGLH